jgi:hypothetical protein
MTITRITCATAVLAGLILHSAACGGSPAAPTAGPAGSPGDPAAPAGVLPEPTQPISLVVGKPTSGVLSLASQRCSYTLGTGTLEGPCRIYGVLGGLGGPVKINVQLAWTSDAEFALARPVRSAATGSSADPVCCQSPLNVVAWVYPFDLTPIAVVYKGPVPLDARGVAFLLSATPR